MKSFATNICNERPASCQQQHVNTIIFIRDAVRDREAVAESAIQKRIIKGLAFASLFFYQMHMQIRTCLFSNHIRSCKKYIFLVFNPAPPTLTNPHFVFTSLHLCRLNTLSTSQASDAFRRDATEALLLSSHLQASCVQLRFYKSYRRARRVQWARAAFACIASRIARLSTQYIVPIFTCLFSTNASCTKYICPLTGANKEFLVFLFPVLSLCAEALCCSLKKLRQTERDREKLQQPVPPYRRWRQALGYCCCFSFKKNITFKISNTVTHPMQSMQNAYANKGHYVDIMHYQAIISHLRGSWEQHAKIIRHRQLQVSGWLMLTVKK